MMKKLLCSIIILAVAGFAHAEIPPLDNPGFESGMSGWGTWGSGSGSGPSGYKWASHWAYIDTTGNAHSGQNFMNLTTGSQLGYCEYWGWGYNVVWPSDVDDIADVVEGDWVKMDVWAKDLTGNGGQIEFKFEWLDASGRKFEDGGIVPAESIYFPIDQVTPDWDYYEAWAQAPADAYFVRPVWSNPDPGKEIGIDDLSFLPEPMSIALLGFGALALRRRK
jgi:hypothetical protein